MASWTVWLYGSQSSFERSAVQLPVVAAVGGGLVTGDWCLR